MSAEQKVIEPELIPYGMKAALVCLDDAAWREAARAYFTREGYYLMDEPDPQTAAAKMRLNSLDVVVAGQNMKAVLEEMDSRPGMRRRETAFFIVGEYKSLDSWTAFQCGADWVLDKGEAARCAELLGEALKRQEAAREPWRLAAQ